jgi:hypothetical protein
MDWSQVKDLEVTTDRWAAPVETDDPLMARVRPLLAGGADAAEEGAGTGPRLRLRPAQAARRPLAGPGTQLETTGSRL